MWVCLLDEDIFTCMLNSVVVLWPHSGIWPTKWVYIPSVHLQGSRPSGKKKLEFISWIYKQIQCSFFSLGHLSLSLDLGSQYVVRKNISCGLSGKSKDGLWKQMSNEFNTAGPGDLSSAKLNVFSLLLLSMHSSYYTLHLLKLYLSIPALSSSLEKPNKYP